MKLPEFESERLSEKVTISRDHLDFERSCLFIACHYLRKCQTATHGCGISGLWHWLGLGKHDLGR